MKIYSLELVAMIASELRADGSRIVHAHGCWDIAHVGHVKHLQAAKQMGDVLIVTVTPDRYIDKGDDRPIYDQQLRVDMLAAMECVDYVALNDGPTAAEAIRRIRPHLFVKGIEYQDNPTPMILAEKAAVESVGGYLAFTQGVVFHSTDLIQRLRGEC